MWALCCLFLKNKIFASVWVIYVCMKPGVQCVISINRYVRMNAESVDKGPRFWHWKHSGLCL